MCFMENIRKFPFHVSVLSEQTPCKNNNDVSIICIVTQSLKMLGRFSILSPCDVCIHENSSLITVIFIELLFYFTFFLTRLLLTFHRWCGSGRNRLCRGECLQRWRCRQTCWTRQTPTSTPCSSIGRSLRTSGDSWSRCERSCREEKDPAETEGSILASDDKGSSNPLHSIPTSKPSPVPFPFLCKQFRFCCQTVPTFLLLNIWVFKSTKSHLTNVRGNSWCCSLLLLDWKTRFKKQECVCVHLSFLFLSLSRSLSLFLSFLFGVCLKLGKLGGVLTFWRSRKIRNKTRQMKGKRKNAT